MTAKALIYARGGGSGHTTRATELAKRIAHQFSHVEIVAEVGSDRFLGPVERQTFKFNFNPGIGALDFKQYDSLFVDTFPRGWENELLAEEINRFPNKIFISRLNRKLNLSELEIFDQTWDPYPSGNSEWNIQISGKKSVGWLVGSQKYEFSKACGPFAIFDPEQRLSANLFKKIQLQAASFGLQAEVFSTIPRKMRFEKALSIGAGYNFFYEVMNCPADIRFFPLQRKYDDQFHRARMWNKSIEGLEQLLGWLQERSFVRSNA